MTKPHHRSFIFFQVVAVLLGVALGVGIVVMLQVLPSVLPYVLPYVQTTTSNDSGEGSMSNVSPWMLILGGGICTVGGVLFWLKRHSPNIRWNIPPGLRGFFCAVFIFWGVLQLAIGIRGLFDYSRFTHSGLQ